MENHPKKTLDTNFRYQVRDRIERLESPEDVFDLFRHLNYPQSSIRDPTFKRDIEGFDFAKDEKSKVKDIYTVLSLEDKLPVFLVETTTLSPSFVRYISKVFAERYLRLLIIFTVDYSELLVVFPEFEKVKIGKHKLKLSKLLLNRQELYYTDIDTVSKLRFNKDWKNWRDTWLDWKKAFSVSRVTNEFFEDYKNRFFRIRNHLVDNDIPTKDAHEFTLQFLNRIMFIYFISKKRWLNNDPKFMDWFWGLYKKRVRDGLTEEDSFYKDWLDALFFESFNNRFFDSEKLPEDAKKVLRVAPFLNGGLFKETDQDKLGICLADEFISDVLDFYNKYNFTIKEDVPLDVEVAVDPQMIGYVYESLANVAEEIYDRNDMGIFYTPRVEVDFMVRRTIAEFLAKHLDDVSREIIYDFVFDAEKEKSGKFFTERRMWYTLKDVLENLSIVDPACGSGAFLVGHLIALTELYKEVYKNIGLQRKDFDIKKGIIGKSLYGVDVMPWAVHAAELRLWLQLIVEVDLKPKDLKTRPLLPNLNMNLRAGDSLVQEIGGINLHLRDADTTPVIKKKLEALKAEKENYYHNRPDAMFQSKEALEKEEIRVFIEIVDEQIRAIDEKVEDIDKSSRHIQLDLSGNETSISREEKEKLRSERKKLIEERETLEKVKAEIDVPEKKPFVWEIAFSEIFGEKGGFDIVIGNPPYVRQEKISPPNRMKAEVTKEERTTYKDKLVRSVTALFPVIEKISKKSDYYVYFYFHGLGLLNPAGTFCFITSNSWLDVGYGKGLQEFLLKYVPIHAIYDNQVSRSFEHADVNTVIALFGAPVIRGGIVKEGSIQGRLDDPDYRGGIEWPLLSHTARFVMFKKPFEEVLSVENLLRIERADDIVKTDEYRVFPIGQSALLEDGWEYTKDYDKKQGRFRKGGYAGNKWGGKYLRAPDIFFTILEKGKGYILNIGDLGKVRYPIKTGINKFFYLNVSDSWVNEIEPEFLVPAIKSSKDFRTMNFKRENIKYLLFICNMSKKELKEKNKNGAYKYIEWGETQKTVGRQKTAAGVPWPKVPSVNGRKYWHSIENIEYADIFCNRFINERFFYGVSSAKALEDQTFYGLILNKNNKNLSRSIYASLNTTISYLFTELFGRVSLGEGILQYARYEMERCLCLILNNDLIVTTFSEITKRELKTIFEELGFDPTKPIHEQEPDPLPDRKALDDVVFDAIGLTDDERKEVYWAVAELVKNRLDKAGSVRG